MVFWEVFWGVGCLGGGGGGNSVVWGFGGVLSGVLGGVLRGFFGEWGCFGEVFWGGFLGGCFRGVF